MLSGEEKALLASADDMGPVKQFISQSLTQKAKEDTYFFDNVCKQLRDRDDPEMVYKVMISLTSYASIFTSDPDCYRDLVTSIFSYDWKSDRKISIAFVNLVGCMVSANATFLIPSFQMLARSLVPTDADLTAQEQAATGGEVESEATIAARTNLQLSHIESLRERQDRIHKTLQGLLRLTPSGQDELFPVLESCFPYKRHSKGILSEFVAQVLMICEYLPSLQEKALDMIMSKCLEIDVEIVIEDTGEVKIVEDYQGENEEDMFHLDDVNDTTNNATAANAASNGVQGSSSNGHLLNKSGRSGSMSNERGQRIPAAVTEMADKLDAILSVVLQYIDRQFARGGAHSERLLHHLLFVFESRVLFTYRSKFVQFLYFYVAQNNPRFASGFCQRLVRVFLETGGGGSGGVVVSGGQQAHVARSAPLFGSPVRSSDVMPYYDSAPVGLGATAGINFGNNGSSGSNNMKVQSAVLYLASYLARARFVPPQQVLTVLAELITWADRYVTQVGAVKTQLPIPYASAVAGGVSATTAAAAAAAASPDAHSTPPGQRRKNKRSLSITDYRDNSQHDDDSDDDDDNDINSRTGHTPKNGRTTTIYDAWGRKRPIDTSVARHETFYTCIQACCYIACFYGVDLAGEVKGKAGVAAAWERALCSSLCPLKFCLQSIRSEFLRLVDECDMFTGFFWASLPPEVLLDAPRFNVFSPSDAAGGGEDDDDDDGEDNTGNNDDNNGKPAPLAMPRVAVGVSISGGGSASPRTLGARNRAAVVESAASNMVIGTGANPLESFFPFDPCLLEILHTSIEANYRRWKGLPGVDIPRDYPYKQRSASRSNTFGSTDAGEDDDGGSDARDAYGEYEGPSPQGGEYSSSPSPYRGAGMVAMLPGDGREGKERGATISSLASSISSVMSLADNPGGLSLLEDSTGGVSSSVNDTDSGRARRLLANGGRRSSSFASSGGSSGGGGNDDEEEDDDNDDDDGSYQDDNEHVNHTNGYVSGIPSVEADKRRPRLYSVGSTDSW
jgi:hypothetical protein